MAHNTTSAPTVAIIGCGAAATAIHTQTLLRLDLPVNVVAACDHDPGAAARIAEVFHARAFTSHLDLLRSVQPDLLVIATPEDSHAQIALDAMNSGATRLLIEKPLVSTRRQADALEGAARRTGSIIMAGAMLTYDVSAQAVIARLLSSGSPVQMIDVHCWLPWNERFIVDAWPSIGDRASEILVQSDGELGRQVILALVSHNMPHIRALVGGGAIVAEVAVRRPFGIIATLTTETAVVRIDTRFDDAAEPDWSLRAATATAEIELLFPPSYVHAGGVEARYRDTDGTATITSNDISPYTAMWTNFLQWSDRAVTPGSLAPVSASALDDIRFTIDIADQVRSDLSGALT